MKFLPVLLSLVAFPTMAADITVFNLENGHQNVVIEGEIVTGDADKFKNLTLGDNVDIILKSEGGMLWDSMEIGKHIREKGYATNVLDSDECLSGCAFIWLAGKAKGVSSEATVGFHGAYDLINNVATNTAVGNALLGAYLSRLGYSDDFIVFATKATPEEFSYLDIESIQTFAIPTNIFKDGKWNKPMETPPISFVQSMAGIIVANEYCNMGLSPKILTYFNAIINENEKRYDVNFRSLAIDNHNKILSLSTMQTKKQKQCKIYNNMVDELLKQYNDYNER